MQWVVLLGWLGLIWLKPKRLRIWLAAGLACAMLAQLLLLNMDRLLTLETALPLHLCGLFGVLSIPMLFRAPKPLYEAQMFLGAPAAFLTLFFPAVMPCSHPLLMKWAFSQLHALIALMPVYHFRTGKPLPVSPQRTLVLGNGYLLLIGAFNRVFQTNYLFLRAAPAGTPLSFLFEKGTAVYICSLEMLCMLAFLWLKCLYQGSRKYVIM